MQLCVWPLSPTRWSNSHYQSPQIMVDVCLTSMTKRLSWLPPLSEMSSYFRPLRFSLSSITGFLPLAVRIGPWVRTYTHIRFTFHIQTYTITFHFWHCVCVCLCTSSVLELSEECDVLLLKCVVASLFPSPSDFSSALMESRSVSKPVGYPIAWSTYTTCPQKHYFTTHRAWLSINLPFNRSCFCIYSKSMTPNTSGSYKSNLLPILK